jgi:hypothetical protein
VASTLQGKRGREEDGGVRAALVITVAMTGAGRISCVPFFSSINSQLPAFSTVWHCAHFVLKILAPFAADILVLLVRKCDDGGEARARGAAADVATHPACATGQAPSGSPRPPAAAASRTSSFRSWLRSQPTSWFCW